MRVLTIIVIIISVLFIDVANKGLQFELTAVKEVKKKCLTEEEEKSLIKPSEKKKDLSSVLNFADTLFFHNKKFDEVVIYVSFMNNGQMKEHDAIVKLISFISKLLKDIEYTEVDPRWIEFVAEERNITILQRSSDIQLIVGEMNKDFYKKVISSNDDSFKIAVEIMGILFGYDT